MGRTFILASHGKLADGLRRSVEMILGQQKNLVTLCAYEEDGYCIEREIENIFHTITEDTDFIVLTDILGGSVNNEFIKVKEKYDFYLISGMNLPLLIELLLNQTEEDTKEYIRRALSNSKKTIDIFEETNSADYMDVFDF